MKYIISVLMRYRYVVMTIMIISMPVLMLTSYGGLPGEKSFLPLLGYLGMIALVEFNDPGPYRRKSYLFLAMIPLVMFACFGLGTLAIVPPDALQKSSSVASLMVLWLLSIVLIGSVGLYTAWIDRVRTSPLYVRVAGVSIGTATALSALVVGAILLPWFVTVLLLLLSFLLLVGELMSFKPIIHPAYRFLVIMSLVLLVAISIGGWRWLGSMSNGVDRFTGEERSAAQEFLDMAYSLCHDNPSTLAFRYRVLKGTRGRFYVQGYTWWRFPIGEPVAGQCYDVERFLSRSERDSRQPGL